MNTPCRQFTQQWRRALVVLVCGLEFVGTIGCSSPRTDHDALVSLLYGHASQSVRYWASANEVPSDLRYVVDLADGVIPATADVDVGLFQIVYEATDLPQFVVHVKGTGHRRALIYNQGHGGLPIAADQYEGDFLRGAFASGYDLLLTSLPLVGYNSPDPNRRESYHMKTGARDSAVSIDPTLLAGPSMHAIYNLIDDQDNFMHYFVDGAVLTSNLITGRSNPKGISDDYRGPTYDDVDYVGLSGGGAVGLITCAVHALRHCVLVAGFVTEDLRLANAANFGDIEQVAAGFYREFTIRELMSLADTNGSLILVYNRNDPCCFADPSASEMQLRFPDHRVVVTDLNIHGYVSTDMLQLLNE